MTYLREEDDLLHFELPLMERMVPWALALFVLPALFLLFPIAAAIFEFGWALTLGLSLVFGSAAMLLFLVASYRLFTEESRSTKHRATIDLGERLLYPIGNGTSVVFRTPDHLRIRFGATGVGELLAVEEGAPPIAIFRARDAQALRKLADDLAARFDCEVKASTPSPFALPGEKGMARLCLLPIELISMPLSLLALASDARPPVLSAARTSLSIFAVTIAALAVTGLLLSLPLAGMLELSDAGIVLGSVPLFVVWLLSAAARVLLMPRD